jgi:predicted NBD/HSP70 family sugar kinase
MRKAIGVWAAEHIAIGLVEDNKVSGRLRTYPDEGSDPHALHGMPSETMVAHMCEVITEVAAGQTVEAVGIGFPGIIRQGLVEESPNLQQVKGLNLRDALSSALANSGIVAPVYVGNDADAMAAGVAATHGYLDRFVRVWTLGSGVGFGRYPWTDGVWEGGHCVITLDPRESFCGCGGQGHLEGIVGHRSMRLRFLDMEPDEVFANARAGEPRCSEFVRMWHRALAAGTATSIHLDGGGKFFFGGPNAKYLDVGLLHQFVADMVKMSPLQSYVFEVFSSTDEIGVIGAAVNTNHAATAA